MLQELILNKSTKPAHQILAQIDLLILKIIWRFLSYLRDFYLSKVYLSELLVIGKL